jgi:hypothetical protein
VLPNQRMQLTRARWCWQPPHRRFSQRTARRLPRSALAADAPVVRRTPGPPFLRETPLTHRALKWFGRAALAGAALLALAAVLVTVGTLIDAGPNAWNELGFPALLAAWPTLAILAGMIGFALLRPQASQSASATLLVAFVAWLVSSTILLFQWGGPYSFAEMRTVSFVEGVPILIVAMVLEITRRRSWPRAPRALVALALALGLAWLVLPMSMIVGCAMSGICP